MRSSPRRHGSPSGFELDPKAAETLVQAVLTGHTDEMNKLGAQAVIENEMLILWSLLQRKPDTELNELLRSAELLAEEWSQGE
jgi:hypothetical protein